MIIKHKLKMDLAQYGVKPRVDVVQGDINSRVVELVLFAGGTPWEVPSGVMVSMRYRKPDGTKGIYDKLPDGSTAWSMEGNVVSIALAPQMLTVPGTVLAQVVMIRDTDLLASFTLQIQVAKDPAAGALKSENYVNWLGTYLKDELNTVFQEAKASGELTGPSPTIKAERFSQAGQSGVNLTVTNPGTDDRPDETTVVSILDGKEGPRGLQGEKGEPGTAGSPRNWLDNSYFYKPVYQSGESSYSGAGPAIDRWTGLEGASMKLSSGGIYEWMGTYTQRVEWDPVLTAGPVTIAVKFATGDVVSATGTLSEISPVTAYFNSAIAELRMNSTKIEFLLYSPGGNPPKWAALYLGEFTLDNLPEYQYKGYAAELMECRRYGLGPDAVSVDVEMLPAGEAATTSVSGTVERMNIALGIPSSAPKPVFVISANYSGGVYWMHQYSGEPATVEELVDAFFGGGIYKNAADSLARNQGAFGISGDGVRYTGCLIYGATEEQYLAALSKYLPEGADAV